MDQNKLQSPTTKPIKRLSWFVCILTILVLLNTANTVWVIPEQFDSLKYPFYSTGLISNSWKLVANLMNISVFVILFFNLIFEKSKRQLTRLDIRIYIIFGMFLLVGLLNSLSWNYTIDRVPNTGKEIKISEYSTRITDYQTKYSIQQIQLATVILSLPSLYAIIMIILTNYYWQKSVKA